ncbi:MAG: GNAT family N-acetyltransferase [Clostridia bacterium]|nr:GNAT family N-acetyltransferase [Clostridia bacterium]
MDTEHLPIVPLPEFKWKGFPIPMRYTTQTYYDVVSERTADGWNTRLEKKRFDKPVTHTPEEYDFPDKLYEDYRPGARAWGIISESGELLGCIETCPEDWSRRLIVSEMWVTEAFRRQGLGHRLMAVAKEQTVRDGYRALILETQSCNTGAIAFYESEGFTLIGFDLCCYSNRDCERREVRLDLGFFPDNPPKNGLEK